MTEIDPNYGSFEKWEAITDKKEGYVAFIDGDPVEYGTDYNNVAANASELRAQRGSDAHLTIFEASTGISAFDTPQTGEESEGI